MFCLRSLIIIKLVTLPGLVLSSPGPFPAIHPSSFVSTIQHPRAKPGPFAFNGLRVTHNQEKVSIRSAFSRGLSSTIKPSALPAHPDPYYQHQHHQVGPPQYPDHYLRLQFLPVQETVPTVSGPHLTSHLCPRPWIRPPAPRSSAPSSRVYPRARCAQPCHPHWPSSQV